MTKHLIIEKIPRIIKNKARLEKALKVKIINNGREFLLEGDAHDEYIGEKVLDALNFGFPFSAAISIKDSGNLFEIINIKEHTNKIDLERVRGRIIGKGGRALKALNELTKCYIEMKDNKVGIIGDDEHIQIAIESITDLIRGAKHANVYTGLERNQPKEIQDLGLREIKKKTKV